MDQLSFSPTQITICIWFMLYLVGMGKEWTGPVFPHPLKSQDCLHIHDKVWLMFSLVGVGKEWAGPVFLHPLKSKGCMCIHDRVRLILSLVGVGKEWAGPVFLHPDNLASAQD